MHEIRANQGAMRDEAWCDGFGGEAQEARCSVACELRHGMANLPLLARAAVVAATLLVALWVGPTTGCLATACA